jgi:hypothetical protein
VIGVARERCNTKRETKLGSGRREACNFRHGGSVVRAERENRQKQQVHSE